MPIAQHWRASLLASRISGSREGSSSSEPHFGQPGGLALPVSDKANSSIHADGSPALTCSRFQHERRSVGAVALLGLLLVRTIGIRMRRHSNRKIVRSFPMAIASES